MKDTSMTCAHSVLGLVKFHFPSLNLSKVGEGMGCPEEQFNAYVDEAEPLADKVAGMLDL
ncbi:hypothetical protein BAE44_0010639 [Dichanthelium oligosanthes]|uniref:Uncharacterized protein n=1 Tax=Dichanthelium oligosanthes TaxID=888268 RepID=A0A1E5VTC8_9POAL|nr:hypothetical protein BAE44_0010639 [Dichanthelium oligosanthes]